MKLFIAMLVMLIAASGAFAYPNEGVVGGVSTRSVIVDGQGYDVNQIWCTADSSWHKIQGDSQGRMFIVTGNGSVVTVLNDTFGANSYILGGHSNVTVTNDTFGANAYIIGGQSDVNITNDTIGVNANVVGGNVGISSIASMLGKTDSVPVQGTIYIGNDITIKNMPNATIEGGSIDTITYIAPSTSTATCTGAGGLSVTRLDLGDSYNWIYVTVSDSCVVGFDANTNIGNGDYVSGSMIYSFRAQYVWVCSQVAYTYPACIRIRGMK